jgi:hypothetical protein
MPHDPDRKIALEREEGKGERTMKLDELCEKFDLKNRTLYDSSSGETLPDVASDYGVVSEVIEANGNFFCVVCGPDGEMDVAYSVDGVRLDRGCLDGTRNEEDISGQLREWLEANYPDAETSVYRA